MVDVADDLSMTGLYGEDPAVERFSDLRRHLHRIAEKDSRQWVLDQRFVTRFVLSGAVFLSVFVVSSVLIRIPVPVVDDLLLALGSAIATYFALARRDAHSRLSIRTCANLRNRIDMVRFETSDTVSGIESVLGRFDRSTPEEILHELKHMDRTRPVLSGATGQRVADDPEVIQDIQAYIAAVLKQDKAYSCRKYLYKWMRKPDASSMALALRKFKKKDVDLSLLALFVFLEHVRVSTTRLAASSKQEI